MYHEEKVINGVMHYRTSPNGPFVQYKIAQLTARYIELKENLKAQHPTTPEGERTCRWRGDMKECEQHTECGQTFTMNAEPEYMGWFFCPSCGGKIVEVE